MPSNATLRAPASPVPTRQSVAALSCQRDAFSLPRHTHYLNCAYMGPLSQAVESAAIDAVRRQRYPTDIPPHEYFAGPQRVRERFARLVHASDATRIALLPSVSYAMASAAANLPARHGGNVVVIGDEFPGSVLAWRRYANEHHITLRTVAAPEDVPHRLRRAVWNERLRDAIDVNTVAVVLVHVHWCDGTVFDLVSLAARARECGAAVLVDGTQSVGALPFDVSAVQPDMLVTAGYKWLMGPYGLSMAYFGPRFDDGRPLEDVWTSRDGSDNFARLVEYRDAYRARGERYDGGQRASFVLAPMLCAALDQLLAWGVDAVQRYCADLVTPFWRQLFPDDADGPAASGRAAHLFGVRVRASGDPAALAERLRTLGVQVSVRGDVVRVSPNVYNDASDLEALCRGVAS